METKSFKVKFKDINEKGEFVAYISTKSIDSYNDKVLPTAFKRTIDHNKGKFPILWMHDASKPIGISTHMVMEKDGVKAFGKINLDTELGKEIYSGMKFDPPYIDRTSIGFVSIDDEYNSKTNIRTIKELKLLEFSLITKNFAANSDALVSSVKSKHSVANRLAEVESKLNELINTRSMDEGMADDSSGDEETMKLASLLERLSQLEERLSGLEQAACGKNPEEKEYMEDDEEEMEEQDEEYYGAKSSQTLSPTWEDSLIDTLFMEDKAVSGAMDLPIADKGTDWDGPAAKARIFAWAGGDDFDPVMVKKAFFYFDPANPNLKSSYKLPFADVVDGKLIVVPKALSSVKGSLEGARGTGVDIPESDKSKIMSKVEAYQKRMNKDKADYFESEILELLNKMIGSE